MWASRSWSKEGEQNGDGWLFPCAIDISFNTYIYLGILCGAVPIRFFRITNGSLIDLLLSNVVRFALWICVKSLEWLLEVLGSLSGVRVS